MTRGETGEIWSEEKIGAKGEQKGRDLKGKGETRTIGDAKLVQERVFR